MGNEEYFEHREDENIVENKELNIWEALIPVVLLMLMLAYNIFSIRSLFKRCYKRFGKISKVFSFQ